MVLRDKIIEDYVNCCPVCAQTAKTIYNKESIIPFIFNGPDFILEFDISYLNEDLATAFGTKYMLSLIDIFSRKGIIYAVNYKKAETLLSLIIEHCIHTNFSKEFASSNGPEFKNAKFEDFLHKK